MSAQGLRFLHFPYLLTLQLKRFDFDYTTMHRIKLNDRMTFPEELDMSPFIDVEDEVRAAGRWGGHGISGSREVNTAISWWTEVGVENMP